MNARNRFQFTTATLLSATALTALALVSLPFACQVYVELVCLFALFICLVASVTDQFPQLSNQYLRGSLSAILAISAIAIVVHLFRDEITWFPLAPMALTISIAFLRPASVIIGKRRIAWSTLGCVVIAAIVAVQVYLTNNQRYFVNRNVTNGYASATYERDGVVSYALHSSLRNMRRHAPHEIETLFDALDSESCYRPITKSRILSGRDKIDSLSFVYATSPSDWTRLRSQSQLEYLELNKLRVSDEELKSLDALRKLHQVSFFACELPPDFLGHLRNAKELWTLQIVDCKVGDLSGLSALQVLRELNVSETQLARSDLSEVAKLLLLMLLDLQDTKLNNEDLMFFATQLKANAAERRGRFRCIVSYEPAIAEGLTALINSGAVQELVLIDSVVSDQELAALRSVDTKVPVTPMSVEHFHDP